jgi:hypothetical protein
MSKKVEIKINEDAGDSAKVYGENYLKGKDGEDIIDPITKKAIAAPFMDTHGDRIFGDLFAAASEKADDPEQIQKDYDEMIAQQQNIPVTPLNVMGLSEELLENDSQVHASNAFIQQESDYYKQMEKEREEYKYNFDKLTEKISEQEKILEEVTEKFNACKDKDEKIKLFHEVHAEMNKLVEISSNYGQAVTGSDTSSVIDSLSSYDNNYDESATRKYIKDL